MRLVGAAIGCAFGLAFIGLGLIVASPGPATEAAFQVGLIVLVLGGLLGATFALGAVHPGPRSALTTSAGVTALAVPLGALSVATLQFGGQRELSLEAVAGTIAIALVGLVLVGLPMAGLTFVVANLWVRLLRVAVRRGGRTIRV